MDPENRDQKTAPHYVRIPLRDLRLTTWLRGFLWEQIMGTQTEAEEDVAPGDILRHLKEGAQEIIERHTAGAYEEISSLAFRLLCWEYYKDED